MAVLAIWVALAHSLQKPPMRHRLPPTALKRVSPRLAFRLHLDVLSFDCLNKLSDGKISMYSFLSSDCLI